MLGQSVATLDISDALDRGRVLLVRPGRCDAGITNLPRRPGRPAVSQAVGAGTKVRCLGNPGDPEPGAPERSAAPRAAHNRTFTTTFGLSALSARAFASELGGDVDWSRIVRLRPHQALLDRGHGEPVELTSVPPERLHGRPPAAVADFDCRGGKTPAEVEAQIAERPDRILAALEAARPAPITAAREPAGVQPPASAPAYSELRPVERRRLIRVMFAQGLSQWEISRQLDVSRITVQRALGRRRGGSPSRASQALTLEVLK